MWVFKICWYALCSEALSFEEGEKKHYMCFLTTHCREWWVYVTKITIMKSISERRFNKNLKKCGQILVVRTLQGWLLRKSARSFPPHLTEPMPAGSRMDLLLAKAQLIRNDGSASVMIYLRKKKNTTWI